MSGIASRIAEMLEPETKPVRKPASSISRAPMPSPQPGMTCSPGWSRSAFIAAACGSIAVPFSPVDDTIHGTIGCRREVGEFHHRTAERTPAWWFR